MVDELGGERIGSSDAPGDDLTGKEAEDESKRMDAEEVSLAVEFLSSNARPRPQQHH